MKRTFCLLYLLISLTSVYASEWRPYVGVAGLVAVPLRYDEYSPHLRLDHQFVSTGTQFDLGVTHGKHEFYLAYHFSNSADQQEWSNSFYPNSDSSFIEYSSMTTKSWHEKRYIVGYHIYPNGKNSNRFNLMLGAAIGAVVSEEKSSDKISALEVTFHPNAYQTYRQIGGGSYRNDHKSHILPEIMLESGFSLKTYRDLYTVFLTQIHLYYIEEEWNYRASNWDRMMIAPTLVLQLRYTFGKDN